MQAIDNIGGFYLSRLRSDAVIIIKEVVQGALSKKCVVQQPVGSSPPNPSDPPDPTHIVRGDHHSEKPTKGSRSVLLRTKTGRFHRVSCHGITLVTRMDTFFSIFYCMISCCLYN